MTRNLKALGLAFVAVLAMSFVAASAASAAEFHGEELSLKLSGSQTTTNVFTTDGGTVTCEKATFTGTTSSTSTTTTDQKVLPKYEECHINIFGFVVGVTIDQNGCEYNLDANGTVSIVCPGTNKIVVTAPGCTITVPSQSGLGTVTYTEEGSGTTRSIIVDSNVSGIDYVEDNKGLFPTCANPGVTTTNGTYTGSVTTSAKNGANEQKGIWVA